MALAVELSCMVGNGQDILTKAFSAIQKRYDDLGLPSPVVSRFGILPGWNTVIGTHGCSGVAMSFRDNNPLYNDDETCFDPATLQAFVDQGIFPFAREYMRGNKLYHRSLSLAALNALSQPLITERWIRERGYTSRIDLFELVGEDDVVAIVGYGGIVRQYAGLCRELHVTDQRPPDAFQATIAGKDGWTGTGTVMIHPAEENKEILSNADVAIITGSTLVNGTFEDVVRYAGNARIRALYGSSAQLFPDVLFENGVNVVMSVAINNPDQFAHDVAGTPDLETVLRRHQRVYTLGCL